MDLSIDCMQPRSGRMMRKKSRGSSVSFASRFCFDRCKMGPTGRVGSSAHATGSAPKEQSHGIAKGGTLSARLFTASAQAPRCSQYKQFSMAVVLQMERVLNSPEIKEVHQQLKGIQWQTYSHYITQHYNQYSAFTLLCITHISYSIYCTLSTVFTHVYTA